MRHARARHVPGEMNGVERRYLSDVLRPRELARDLLWWSFEPLKLQIGERCFYTPDFIVVSGDGTIECHEVKAFWKNVGRAGWQEDARVKIKAAASRFPFLRFIAAAERRERGRAEWQFEEIHSDGSRPLAEAAGAPAPPAVEVSPRPRVPRASRRQR